jgi:hypothetical protein
MPPALQKLLLLFFLSTALTTAEAQRYSLLIKGGWLIDPGAHITATLPSPIIPATNSQEPQNPNAK